MMPAEGAPTLLPLPAGEAARRLALLQLGRAAAACWRLTDPADLEALHDFRVALRRLRGSLRAFAEPLAGSVGAKWPRRLGRVARATGEGREAEVALSWVESQREPLGRRYRRGVDRMAAYLAARKQAAYDAVRRDVPRRFSPLAERLRRRLTPAEAAAGSASPELPFAHLLAEAARRRVDRLTERLAEVGGIADQAACHRARIAAKRLRYVLEPVADEVEGAGKTVRRLKKLQDLLGDLNDTHVFEREVAAAVEGAAAEQARELLAAALGEGEAPQPATRRWEAVRGLLALARANRERRDRLYGELERDWLAGGATGRLVAAVDELADELVERHPAAWGDRASEPETGDAAAAEGEDGPAGSAAEEVVEEEAVSPPRGEGAEPGRAPVA